MVTGKHIGNGNGGIVFSMIHSHGLKRTAQFIDDVTFVVNHWLTTHTATFNIDDLVLNLPGLEEEKSELIKLHTEQAFDIGRSMNMYDAKRDEDHMIKVAENLKAKIFNYIVERVPTDNIMALYTRAELGKIVANMPQIIGIIGQMFVHGKRIIPTGRETRCLPTYDPGDRGLQAGGCILSSFAGGMDMSEHFFSHMSGRESLINMGVLTQVTGDIYNNKLVSGFTGIIISPDGTVRNTVNRKIIQYIYGEDGTSAGHLRQITYGKKVKVNNKNSNNVTSSGVSFTDIRRIINRLNTEYGFDIHNNFVYSPLIVAKRIKALTFDSEGNTVLDGGVSDDVHVVVKGNRVNPHLPPVDTGPSINCDDLSDLKLSAKQTSFIEHHREIVNGLFKDFYMDNRRKATQIASVRMRLPRRKIKGYNIHIIILELWYKSIFIVDNARNLVSKNMEATSNARWELFRESVNMRIDIARKYLVNDKDEVDEKLFQRYKFDAYTRDALMSVVERRENLKLCTESSAYNDASLELSIRFYKESHNGKVSEGARKRMIDEINDKYKKNIDQQLSNFLERSKSVQDSLNDLWDNLDSL